ncbi:MAG TPA: desulfoferrodoxin family protein [Coriobacteriia bacterium]
MGDSAVLDINRVADFGAASDFEKKHTPFVTLEPMGNKVRISVEVGHEVPHPNGTDHYITSIEVYTGPVPLARFYFTPVTAYPVVSVVAALPAGTVITAVGHCNLHGFWSYEQTV